MRYWLLVLLALAPGLAAADFPQDRARKLYDRGDFQGSLLVLLQLPRKDAAAHDLIGRNYFMLGDYKRSTAALQEAVATGRMWAGLVRTGRSACPPRPVGDRRGGGGDLGAGQQPAGRFPARRPECPTTPSPCWLGSTSARTSS